MNLPQDLKHYSAEDDAFQLLTGDQCVVLLCVILVIAYAMKDYL